MTQPKGREPGVYLDDQTAAMARLRFDKYWMPIPFCGCWVWMGGTLGKGYGRFHLPAAANFAHRAAWLLYRGGIPGGLFVCHDCDVPCCVNPDHLFLGTCADNLRDMMAKGRAGFQKRPEAYRQIGRAMVARGDHYNGALLTDKDVEIVRYLAARGAFHVDIAKALAVPVHVITDILREHTYRGTLQ